MTDIITRDILFFFDGKPFELSLYERLAGALLSAYPETTIKVQKTQIGFCDRHLFACVSLTPVRRRAGRPEHFVTVSFGLDRPLDDPRALAVQVRSNRWTHHVVVGEPDEINEALMDWIDRSHGLARKEPKHA